MSLPRVLVVDDEPSMRWTMAEFLRRAGCEPLPAADIDGALALVGEGEVDAAVVDIILPGRSGLELLRELSGRDTYVPVVMITGEPNSPEVAEVVRMGAYDFIPKPVKKDALLKAVAGAVERKRLVDEKRRLEQALRRHAEELEVRVAERTAELAQAHNFLNLVLDSSTEYAIVATDTEGRITLFNRGAESMFGYEASQALGQEPCALSGREDEEQMRRIFGEGVREADASGSHRVEVHFRRAGGDAFPASVAVSPIRRHGGEIIGHLGVIKDLTAEREAAERLRRMQERLAHQEKIAALGRAAAQVAHEVKNPLAGLLLYSMHLKAKAADKLAEGELTLIDKIVNTINHLTATVNQVLDYARPINLRPRPADLNRIVTDVLQLLRPQIEAARIEQRMELDAACCRVVLDEPSIHSALMNLMLNAVQSMHGGGTLAVRTRGDAAGGVELEISDTGIGMSEEQVRNIFEPFVTTKSQGLGLGMPYAQKVVEQHRGAVSIESRPGEGTTVRVVLPGERGASGDANG
jgi:PAS domain S-box-containing protein